MSNNDYYSYLNTDGEEFLSNLPKDCRDCYRNFSEGASKVVECKVAGKRRRAFKKFDEGSIYFCTSSKDMVNSTKIFNKILRSHETFLNQYKKMNEKNVELLTKPMKRLEHNLIGYNAHCIQGLYSLFPQEGSSKNYKKQIESIQKIISDDSNEAAEIVFDVYKNSNFIKNEMTVFKRLNNPKLAVKRRLYSVDKVFLNVFHRYSKELSDKGINLLFQGNQDAKISVDYDSVCVVFSHLLNNIEKYVLPKTTLHVSVELLGNKVNLTLDMTSLEMSDNDIENIFEDGYSGELPIKLTIGGSGIGMYIVKRLLTINNADIEVKRDNTEKRTKHGVNYCNNKFIISFNI